PPAHRPGARWRDRPGVPPANRGVDRTRGRRVLPPPAHRRLVPHRRDRDPVRAVPVARARAPVHGRVRRGRTRDRPDAGEAADLSLPRIPPRMGGRTCARVGPGPGWGRVDGDLDLRARRTVGRLEAGAGPGRGPADAPAGSGRSWHVAQSSNVIRSQASSTSPGPEALSSFARASTPSNSSSVWSGSWWKSTSRREPALRANVTVSSVLEFPQPTRSSYSTSVYWASCRSTAAPSARANPEIHSGSTSERSEPSAGS